MRNRVAAGACAIAAFLLATAPASAFGAGMAGSAPSHELRVTVGTLGSIGSLDPRHGNSTVAREVWNLQYPTLTALDEKTLAPAPGLANGWVPTPGGRGWVYTLSKGLAWSDGRPVTAADVVYSLVHARDEHWPYAGTTLAGLKVRAVNDRTVEVTSSTGKQPPAGLLLHVVPEHVFAQSPDLGPDPSKLGVSDGTWHVVATAPDSVELDATTNTASPAVRQIVFRTYPNAGALIDALAHKHVDVVSGVPAADVGRLEGISGVTVNHASDGTQYVLRFESPSPVPDPGRLPFDADTRRAISLAIDRDALVADAVYGVGTPAAVAAQPERARSELKSAGATLGNSVISIAPDPTSQRVGAVVRADLAAVGLHTPVGTTRASLVIERWPVGRTSPDAIELFEPDTLQAFRSDNVSGWLPEPQQRRLVVFSPTVAQYGELGAAGAPPGEGSSNGVYALGAVIVLALCAVLYWVASRFRRRFATSEETDAS